MSVAEHLYGRYKALALSTGAALLLDAPDDAAADEARALAADARAALAEHPEQAAPLQACVAAADALARLDPAAPDEVRAAHRALRAAMWAAGHCELVPCGAEAHRA